MYAENKMTTLPTTVYVSGISKNITNPIPVAKINRVYSKGATNKGVEYFKAVIVNICTIVPKIPIINKIIQSLLLIGIQELKLNANKINVIPIFVYRIMVAVESCFDSILLTMREPPIKILANNELRTAKFKEKEVGRITIKTPIS